MSQKKVEELLSKMTIEEKVGQLTQYGTSIYGGVNSPSEDYIRAGRYGSFICFFEPETINHLQKLAVEESRLGIPILFANDVIHGYKTIFPIPLAEACSWNPELAEKAAYIAAKEASSEGTKWTFAPMVDISRDSRWGRVAEGAGEDTYLGRKMAQARVKGFQGEDYSANDRVVACAKHYVGYGAGEGGRDYNSVDMSLQTLHETYLPPFKAAIDAKVGTVMSAFHSFNGIPCTTNKYLLTEILKKTLGFKGVVVSDWDAVNEILQHRFAGTKADAVKAAIEAGVDIDMGSAYFDEVLAEMVAKGVVPIEVLDNAVRKVLQLKYDCGLFDNPYVDVNLHKSVILCDEHIKVARQSARESMVLLKNEGILPLKKTTKKIAVVGPLADDAKSMLGCWSCLGSEHNSVSILKGIQNAVSDKCTIVANQKAASKADVIVAVVGEISNLSGEGKNRTDIGLPDNQLQFLNELKATGLPLVVVLCNGRPLSIPWVAENADAILEAWHGGIQAGNAVADILFGDYNPSGKLVNTFPYAAGCLPFYYNHLSTGRPPLKHIIHTSKYMDAPIDPVFCFGYGLSYTKYKYSDLKVNCDNDSFTASAVIKNEGKIPGDEVVQLYVSDLVASRVRPVKELKGFDKLHLDAGQAIEVSFTVPYSELGFYDYDMNYIVEPGDFKVWIGPNCCEGLEGMFTINR